MTVGLGHVKMYCYFETRLCPIFCVKIKQSLPAGNGMDRFKAHELRITTSLLWQQIVFKILKYLPLKYCS